MNNIVNNPSRSVPLELSQSECQEHALRSVFPLSFDMTPNITLERKDYMHITYWHQKDWSESEKIWKAEATKKLNASSSKLLDPDSIGVHLRFLKDEDGATVKKGYLNEMCLFLHCAFMELEKIMPDIIPTSWKTHGEYELMDRCYSNITQWFPELKLCSASWKAQLLVMDWFPGWKRPWENNRINTSTILANVAQNCQKLQGRRWRKKRLLNHSLIPCIY